MVPGRRGMGSLYAGCVGASVTVGVSAHRNAPGGTAWVEIDRDRKID
jgi:hypothetical protein